MMNPYQNYMTIPQNTNYVQKQLINGKYVNDFSEITANDVPMDVPSSIFIKTDGSEIQVRSWNGNGLIESRTYKPILDEKSVKTINSSTNEIKFEYEHFNNVLDDIKTSIDTVLESVGKIIDTVKPKTTSKVKKEVDET